MKIGEDINHIPTVNWRQ